MDTQSSRTSQVFSGNAYVDGARQRGWFVGHFLEHTDDLRATPLIEVKWGVEILARLKKIELPGAINFEQAKALAKSAAAAIQAGKFGYAVIIATRPQEQSDPTQGGR